jgi:hypothetical protein
MTNLLSIFPTSVDNPYILVTYMGEFGTNTDEIIIDGYAIMRKSEWTSLVGKFIQVSSYILNTKLLHEEPLTADYISDSRCIKYKSVSQVLDSYKTKEISITEAVAFVSLFSGQTSTHNFWFPNTNDMLYNHGLTMIDKI